MVKPLQDYEMERHADPLDRASDDMLMSNHNHLEHARAKLTPEKYAKCVNGKERLVSQEKDAAGNYPFPHCVEEDCGEELPAARLEMGRIRCTECQTKRERASRGRH
jgi:RNA polymerase-binding transcription factor DksA